MLRDIYGQPNWLSESTIERAVEKCEQNDSVEDQTAENIIVA